MSSTSIAGSLVSNGPGALVCFDTFESESNDQHVHVVATQNCTITTVLSAYSEVWHLITEAAEEAPQEVIGDVRAEAHASSDLVSVQLPVVVGPRPRPLQYQ